jgi:hypothetical protein
MRNQIFVVGFAVLSVVGCGRSDEPSADTAHTVPDAPRSVVFDIAASDANDTANAVNEAAKAWQKVKERALDDAKLDAELGDRSAFDSRFITFQMERRKADGRSTRELLTAAGFKPLVADALLR